MRSRHSRVVAEIVIKQRRLSCVAEIAGVQGAVGDAFIGVDLQCGASAPCDQVDLAVAVRADIFGVVAGVNLDFRGICGE